MALFVMMQGYYQEIIKEIEKLLQEKKPQEAETILNKELSMPYIPLDVEKKLHELQRDIRYALSENSGRTRISEDEMLEDLKGNEEAQMRAASSLYEANLRSYVNELQAYLINNPYPEAAALLIEGIAEQEIGDEFVLNRDGIEYTFWGDAIVPVNKSAGFIKALKLLKEWLGDKHPDMYALARTLLIHKAYLFLPLSYEEDEGEQLALEVLKEISSMMDDGEVYHEILTWRNQLS